MARIEPGVVVVHVEDPRRHVVDERVEALPRILRVADAPREERVAGEQVRGAFRIQVGEGDGASGVPAQVDDVQRDLAEPYLVPLPQRFVDGDRQPVRVFGAGESLRST